MVEYWKKLSVKEFTDSLGFPLALAAFAHSAEGFNASLEWSLTILTGLMAIVLFFKNQISSSWWKALVKWVEEYDFGYIVFGLGLMTGGSTITDNYWGIILFMLAGAGFLAMGISRLNSRRMKDLSETSPKLAIIIGIVLVALGVSWGLIRWNEILKAPIEGVDALRGYWLLAMGMAYAIAGLLMQGRRRKETFMVDFQI